jgi:hypothetical protein
MAAWGELAIEGEPPTGEPHFAQKALPSPSCVPQWMQNRAIGHLKAALYSNDKEANQRAGDVRFPKVRWDA